MNWVNTTEKQPPSKEIVLCWVESNKQEEINEALLGYWDEVVKT